MSGGQQLAVIGENARVAEHLKGALFDLPEVIQDVIRIPAKKDPGRRRTPDGAAEKENVKHLGPQKSS